MNDEPNDFAEAEIDNVDISEDDDSEQIEHEDLEADDLVADDDDETDDEVDDDEPEEDGESESDDTPVASEIADDVLVKMPDGASIRFGDLKESPMLKADHTRKTQETANERKALAEQAQLMQNVTDAFVQHMQQTLPPEPPIELMATDPNKHYMLSVQRQQAIAQVQNILQMADQPKQVANALSQDDMRRQAVAENEKLVQMFPDALGGESRKAFFSDIQGVAEQLGYTIEELNGVTDHRVFALAHWAKKGMEADKAKATVKAKVKKAPPGKATKPAQVARGSQQRAKARARLLKDDSIENAVALFAD